jgi:hypothetical protein
MHAWLKTRAAAHASTRTFVLPTVSSLELGSYEQEKHKGKKEKEMAAPRHAPQQYTK